MIDLFTYLSLTAVSIGQLYQFFIVALLSILILFSTYFSLKKLPASPHIKDRFYVLFVGFITIILNVGLFFVFLYLAKHFFFLPIMWLPVFSFIIRTIEIAAQTILAVTLIIAVTNHEAVRRIVKGIFLLYGIYIATVIVLMALPWTSSTTGTWLLQSNWGLLAGNLTSMALSVIFFFISRFKTDRYLKSAIASLFIANGFHSLSILFPFLMRYIMAYNLLLILGYLLIEIFIFDAIIRELSSTTHTVEGLNNQLEEKIKSRTEELYTSNKELFHSNYMLHQEKEKLNSLIENLEEGILVSNISHSVLMINTSAKNLLGIERSVIGASLFDVISDKAYIQDIHQIILKKVRFISKEITVPHPARQSSYLLLRSSLSVDSKGNIIGIITLLRDITKEKELENLKSGFMRTISHELKTPLTTIIGFTETLSNERRGTLNDDQKNYIKIILDEGIHLSRLINDLLEFTLITSNKITLQFEEISLKSLISEILDSFRPQATLKNIELSFDASTNLPSIQADREKIHRAFLNVIHNAIHFTETGGVSISFYTEKNKIITKISDTGIGIDPTNLDKIFERFIQVDADGKAGFRSGLGLGLSISRDLVALHDGRIWAESKQGEGSTFYIELPVAR